jgi:eukaryotic-like serine/threonine-protein kinase
VARGLDPARSRFAGFAMRKIAFDRTLELDYLLNRRQSALEGFDADYGKLVDGLVQSRLDHPLSARQAHCDRRPQADEREGLQAELYVSILDCDGFHIAADDFRSDAPQVTPEYLAPEFHDKAVAAPEAQDRFALATIIFPAA